MSQTFTGAELTSLPSSDYALRGDVCVGCSEPSSWDRSSDAIGGAYGISWYEVFQEPGGKRYKVFCTDGMRGGRGPYRDEDDDR